MFRTKGLQMIVFLGLSMVMMTFNSANTQDIDDVERLIQDKTRNYNTKIRPVRNQSDSVTIYLQFDLVSIQALEEVSGKFSVVGFLSMGWPDQRLPWDPADYGNVTEFVTEGTQFWKPNLVLINSYDQIEAVGDAWNTYRFFSHGVSAVSPGTILHASCSVDVTKYPWDEQMCSLLFVAWGYLSNEIKFSSIQDTVGQQYFIGNGIWDLTETMAIDHANNATTSDTIEFVIRMKRRPRFILVNVIVPIILMSFLNMLVFLIPTESGERISYCLTMLLAMAVFLTLVGDHLPKTSTPMSLLSYYLLIIVLISTCIIFATVFSLRIYHHDYKKPVPSWLQSVVRFCCCDCKRDMDIGDKYRYRRPAYNREGAHLPRRSPNPCSRNDGEIFVTNGLPVMHHDLPESHVTRQRSSIGRRNSRVESFSATSGEARYPDSLVPPLAASNDDEDDVTWRDVSCMVDIVFFLIFLLALVISTVVLFVMIIK